jgi:hypothetical protein
MMDGSKLVVAFELPDGSVDSRYTQPLNEFLYEKPSINIIRAAKGAELLHLLEHYLGIVSVDEQKLKLYLDYNKNFEKQRRRRNEKAGRSNDVSSWSLRLLGYLAEALIVERCYRYPEKNRLWGKYARRSQHKTGRAVEIIDNYVAIATGLSFTERNPLYRTKYSPNDTQRDIIWLRKDKLEDKLKEELSMTGGGSSGYHRAGLQIKVSINGKNVLQKIREKKEYEVPVVYFDLRKDFEWVAEQLRRDTEIFEKTRYEIGVDLIRGSSVYPEIHDILLHFLPLLEELLNGRLELSDLLQEQVEVGTAFTRSFIETRLNKPFSFVRHKDMQKPVPVLTLPI